MCHVSIMVYTKIRIRLYTLWYSWYKIILEKFGGSAPKSPSICAYARRPTVVWASRDTRADTKLFTVYHKILYLRIIIDTPLTRYNRLPGPRHYTAESIKRRAVYRSIPFLCFYQPPCATTVCRFRGLVRN